VWVGVATVVAVTVAVVASATVAGAVASAPPAVAASVAAAPACVSSLRHHLPRRVTGAKAPSWLACRPQGPMSSLALRPDALPTPHAQNHKRYGVPSGL
jgi:hypothetical protein